MLRLIMAGVLLLSLQSCSKLYQWDNDVFTDNFAERHGFEKRYVKSGKFWIATYQKISNNRDSYAVYIEGSGNTFSRYQRISEDPTPKYDFFLKSALAVDHRPNVIYVAHPCQYLNDGMMDGCTPEYWTSKDMSQEVVDAIDGVINQLTFTEDAHDNAKKGSVIKNVDLIGYESGGGIAVLIAASNPHVRSIITVAGKLDPEALAKYRHEDRSTLSLNPMLYASKVSHIPQVHYYGDRDDYTPVFISHDFTKAVNDSTNHMRCARSEIVQKASHKSGWNEVWDYVLAYQPACTRKK